MKTKMFQAFSLAALILVLSACGADGDSSEAVVPDKPEMVSQASGGSDAAAEISNEEDGADIADVEDETEPSETIEALPNTQWEFDTPESRGMGGDLLTDMHTALEDTRITSAVTVKNGVIVDEYYQEDYDETSVFRFNSGSKSVTSALIGIAIDEGLIEGVDVSIAEYFPELAGTNKEDITIRHLLEHTSGLEWYEFGGSAQSFWALNDSDNWVKYVLERPLVATPGSVFNYTTGGTHLLGAILEQAVDGTMLDYAWQHIFTPLGMDSVHWRVDPQGIPDAGNGIEMTTRDAAKFGQLFLNGGNWGEHSLVPEEWVSESTSVQVVRNGTTNGSYGYQWWILPMGGYNTYYALGAGGQFILVVPELDLVAVMTCGGDTNAPYTYIANYIIAACS